MIITIYQHTAIYKWRSEKKTEIVIEFKLKCICSPNTVPTIYRIKSMQNQFKSIQWMKYSMEHEMDEDKDQENGKKSFCTFIWIGYPFILMLNLQ